jgi:hypothetical protein
MFCPLSLGISGAVIQFFVIHQRAGADGKMYVQIHFIQVAIKDT